MKKIKDDESSINQSSKTIKNNTGRAAEGFFL